jgi:hypothetical protein
MMRVTAAAKRTIFAGVGLIVLLVAGLLIAQAVGGDDGNSPSADVTSSPSPSDEPSPTPQSPREAVREAYLHHWDVYLEAVRTLKTDGLDEVFTGKALAVVTKGIERRRREGTPIRIRVEHDMGIKIVDATTAVVDDRYINRAAELDPKTGKPTKRYPAERIHDVFTVKKVNGLWKVSAIVRQSVRRLER